MSYQLVLTHLEKLLNQMNNSIQIVSTGSAIQSHPGLITVEIKPITILNSFNQNIISVPMPKYTLDTNTTYQINRIRISTIMIDDYSKKYPYSDGDLLEQIYTNPNLFAYYP